MYAINQIEYHLGYVVIAATNQDRYTIWTLHKPLPVNWYFIAVILGINLSFQHIKMPTVHFQMPQ